MRKINLLDCTLRDGGYINNWKFGFDIIRAILQKLCMSNVDYVECGYLSEKKGGDENYTQYKCFDALRKVLPGETVKQHFAVMIDYGQCDIDHIPEASEDAPIIRVCFHKKDVDGALLFCSQLMAKGYTVFVQPMASLNYSDVEFVEMIRKINEMNPACFYIVDSFGVIEIEDFQRILFLADHNLKSDIILGYHAHNNLQQAYGNAKYMVEQNLTHNIMLDASVYGMGRGAGNLNMELFASYLNKNYDKSYNIDAFLDIMDLYLKPIFAEHYWGYSLPFYLSAHFNCHPNYAGYFADKNTLSNKSMRQLLASLPDDVKIRYSESEAEKYYQAFQKKYVDDAGVIDKLKNEIRGREILILAPGKSLETQRTEVETFIEKEKPVIIAINVVPTGYKTDYVFCANEKRIKNLEKIKDCKLIVSSNVNVENSCTGVDALTVNYSSYLSDVPEIADNPTLMMIRILMAAGIKKVSLAGFDGYSAVAAENYYDKGLAMGTSVELKIKRNGLIKDELIEISNLLSLFFITKSKYQ